MHTVKLHRLLAGLAVGTGLFLSGARALADKDQEHASGKSGRVPLPTVNVTRGEQCVEPTDDMRRNHMKYIMHQRDKTMHQGIRTTQHSLKNCVDCHADPKTNSVIGKDGFCSSCHQYAAVTTSRSCGRCTCSRSSSAALYTFNRPALDTWPARLLEPELLPSANAVDWSLGKLDSMAAPIAAGFMLATIGPPGAFVFDALTFLAVIVMVSRMKPSPGHDDVKVSWEAIKEGFRFLKGKRNVQSVFLADLNAMIFGFPVAQFPAVALSFGGEARQEEVLGLLFAAGEDHLGDGREEGVLPELAALR